LIKAKNANSQEQLFGNRKGQIKKHSRSDRRPESKNPRFFFKSTDNLHRNLFSSQLSNQSKNNEDDQNQVRDFFCIEISIEILNYFFSLNFF